MQRICDFCSTSSAAVHCKADAAHLCLSCDSELQVVSRLPRTILCDRCGSGLMCYLCDQGHYVTTSPLHQRLSSNGYTCCPAAEDFAEIWDLQMDHDLTCSTSDVWSLDILGQILDLQTTQSPVPLGLCSSNTSQLQSDDKMQDQVGVSADDQAIPDDDYLAFLNLEELIGNEDDQDLIVKTQQLLDDHENNNDSCLDTAAESIVDMMESSSIHFNGSSCSLPSSIYCNTLSSSIVSHEQVFDARANAMMRYKQKKHARVYERTIRYEKKKAIADSRKRVRGRFVRK